jgi:hypothetical protein
MENLENELSNLREEHKELKKRFDSLESLYLKNNFTGEQIFTKKITFKGDTEFRNNKLGFFSTEAIVQKDTIENPSGSGTAGVDSSARTAINSILTVLKDYGIIKSA